jgi:hypothetical protein
MQSTEITMLTDYPWEMDDDGRVLVLQGEIARGIASASPLFLSAARDRNADLGIDRATDLFDDAPIYRVKAAVSRRWVMN